MRAVILGFVMALAFARPAFADPTYLECTLAAPQSTSVSHLDVTLNEASNTAGFLLRETGYSPQNIPAVFTAREVTFTIPGSLNACSIYRIDRVSLEFSNDVRSVDGSSLVVRTGTCVVASVPQRAF
ncbi:MAG: hypothetical protein HXY28_00135 [Hydrogenophilaceae bacterium]|jgi:hypothetical protein|nr:hypothetical protein [Hydrogenophilaceae bacterium]